VPPPPPNAIGVTSAQRTDGPSAAAQIADARCRHADICREVGPNRPYPSRAACVTEAEQRAEVDLHSADCPREVDTMRLETCLTKITVGSCSDTNAQFETLLACSSGQLCP
jgi:hypothetical protein